MNKKQYRFIPSLDCTDLRSAMRIVESTASLECVYGYKVGFALGLTVGLKTVVAAIKKIVDKPVIYDHQKGATDIPDTGALFAETMKISGIDEAILFPQAGPETLRAWIKSLRESGIKIIVGAIMTHAAYMVSEGGFISDAAPKQIFSLAKKEDVNAFVVPLTKPKPIKEMSQAGCFSETAEFYSPGYGAQGGNPADFDFVRRHYLIIGRSLFKAEDPNQYLVSLDKELKKQS